MMLSKIISMFIIFETMQASEATIELSLPKNFWFIWSWVNHDQIQYIQQTGYQSISQQTGYSRGIRELFHAYLYAPFFVYTQIAPYHTSTWGIDTIGSKEDRMWIKYGAQKGTIRDPFWDTILIINPSIVLERDDIMLCKPWTYGKFNPDETKYIGNDTVMRKDVTTIARFDIEIDNDPTVRFLSGGARKKTNYPELIKQANYQKKTLLNEIRKLGTLALKSHTSTHELLFYNGINRQNIGKIHRIEAKFTNQGICLHKTGNLIANNVTRQECFAIDPVGSHQGFRRL
eukprot:524895_1